MNAADGELRRVLALPLWKLCDRDAGARGARFARS